MADETITWWAPLCLSSGAFSASRTAAMIRTWPAVSCRTVSATSTDASSLSVAMMTDFAVRTCACSSTDDRVAEPSIVTSPLEVACRSAGPLRSTTTILDLSVPFSSRAETALRPLVP